MIVLMNYAVLLILVVGVVAALKLKKFWIMWVAVAIAFVYTVAQPTYIPKGVVPAPWIEETIMIDKPIVDRSLKPMSDEERDAKRILALKAIDDSIQEKIKSKENK